MAEREVHPIVKAAQELAPSVARQSTEWQIIMGPERNIEDLDALPVIPDELTRTFNPEAEEYLNTHPIATVIVAVDAVNRPDISPAMTEKQKRSQRRKAGQKDLAEIVKDLKIDSELDERIIFHSNPLDSSLRVTAPSEFVRSLAQRKDVVDIYTPQPKTPKK